MDSNSSGTRKRGRPLDQQHNSSSPSSVATSLSAAKKRKLGTDASSATTPKALEVLKTAISGAFGFGRKKETTLANIPPETQDPVNKATQKATRYSDEPDELSRAANDVGEPSSEDNFSATPKAQVIRANGRRRDITESPTPSRKRKRSRTSTEMANAEAEEEDELSALAKPLDETTSNISTKGARSNEAHQKRKLATSATFSSPLRLGRNRTEALGDVVAEEQLSSGGGARSSGRERRKPRRYSNEMLEGIKLPPRGILTPSKIRHKAPRKSVTFEVEDSAEPDAGLDVQYVSAGEDVVQLSPSLRKKRVRSEVGIEGPFEHGTGLDNQHALVNDEPMEPPSLPKRGRGRPKKVRDSALPAAEEPPISSSASVEKSGRKSIEAPKKSRRSEGRKPSSQQPPAIGNDDWSAEDEDDTKCIICDGGDSEPPNEILLCDSCDLAAHQKCYGVGFVPELEWLCRDCQPDAEEELSLVETGTISEPLLDIGNSNVPEIEGFEYHLQIMQKVLLDKLTGQRQLKLYGLEEEYRKVHQVIEQTVVAGEGNSMVVIGARGCGKTALVESVMLDVSKHHSEDFHVVRLNGFIHTDDKLALREIWRQLGREMEVEDEITSKTSNYADTLASLLALLSHPSEISDVVADHTAKSVIFIIDEFDLFTSHPRQTLLYNLFDIAQARKAPIAVLGITTKIDVVERLEKRVKSRFSHRYVHVALPRSLSAYWEICRRGLIAETDELVEEGFNLGLSGQEEFQSFWESMINDLYNKDASFKQHLQLLFYRSKSISLFLTTCILPIANLNVNNLPLTGTSFISNIRLTPPDSKLHLLPSLSNLDLALLIAAARLNIILDTETCNFAMAYDEYCSLTSKHKIQSSSSGVAALGAGAKVWGREVASGAWERLVGCELLVPAGAAGTAASGRDTSGREVRMWKVDVGLEEIPGSVDLSGIMAKWCREI